MPHAGSVGMLGMATLVHGNVFCCWLKYAAKCPGGRGEVQHACPSPRGRMETAWRSRGGDVGRVGRRWRDGNADSRGAPPTIRIDLYGALMMYVKEAQIRQHAVLTNCPACFQPGQRSQATRDGCQQPATPHSE